MNEYYSHFYSARTLTELLENRFEIGKLRFGLDPLLGLFPYFGDLISLLLSFYIIWIAVKFRMPGGRIAMMIGNVIYDFLIGLIPLLGDLADFAFKANSRNLKIIEEFIGNSVPEAKIVSI